MPAKGKTTQKKTKTKELLVPEKIAALVLWIRGEKVLLDSDLAQLYGVETKALKQAVRRNIDRFPEDFMFQLTKDEIDTLQNPRSQFVTLESGHNIKYPPLSSLFELRQASPA